MAYTRREIEHVTHAKSRFKSAVRAHVSVRELRSFALLERVVHWIFGGAAESQVAPGQSLERSQGDLESWLLMIQGLLLNVSRNVELDLSGDGSVYPAGRLPGWCLLQMIAR